MVCDAHIHVGQYYRMEDPETFVRHEYYYAPELIAKVLEECDVGEFIFSSLTCQCDAQLEVIEREARQVQASFGSGAHPFLWLTGSFYDADRGLTMLDNPLWEGVKIHELETPWVKERPKDLDRILSILEERGLPVQFHAGEDDGCHPHQLLPFARRHGGVRIDLAHCRPYREMIECLKQCTNLFTDTAFMPAEYYPDLVSENVEGQVMFGTDLPIQAGFYKWPLRDVTKTLSSFYNNELSAVKAAGYSEKVMSENFKRYLKRK